MKKMMIGLLLVSSVSMAAECRLQIDGRPVAAGVADTVIEAKAQAIAGCEEFFNSFTKETSEICESYVRCRKNAPKNHGCVQFNPYEAICDGRLISAGR